MSTPMTEAGRALIEWAERSQPTNQQAIWRDHIVSIEAEARRDVLAEARKQLRTAPGLLRRKSALVAVLSIVDALAEAER